ncbi:MAG: LbFV-ORF5-like protein [Cotesia congregata filamentous virus 2]
MSNRKIIFKNCIINYTLVNGLISSNNCLTFELYCNYNILKFKDDYIFCLLHSKLLDIFWRTGVITKTCDKSSASFFSPLVVNIFYQHTIKCSHPFNNGVTIKIKVSMANLLSENRILYHNNVFDLKLYNFLFQEYYHKLIKCNPDNNTEKKDFKDLIEKALYNIFISIQKIRYSIRNKIAIENKYGECLNIKDYDYLLNFENIKEKILSSDIKEFYNQIEKIFLTYSFNDDASINMLMNKYYKIEQQSSLSVKHSNVKNNSNNNSTVNFLLLNGNELKNTDSNDEIPFFNNIQNIHINFTNNKYKYYKLKINYDCLYRLIINGYVFGVKILKNNNIELDIFNVMLFFFERYEILILQYLIKYYKRYKIFQRVEYSKKCYMVTRIFLRDFKICYDLKKMSYPNLYILDPYILNFITLFVKNIKREPIKRREFITYFCCFEINFLKKKILNILNLRIIVTKNVKMHDLLFVYCYVIIDPLDNKIFLCTLMNNHNLKVKDFTTLNVQQWIEKEDGDLLLYDLWNNRSVYTLFFTTDVESLYNNTCNSTNGNYGNTSNTNVELILKNNSLYIKNLTYCVYMFTLKKLSPTVDTDIESYLWNITYLRVIKSIINNSSSILNFNYNNPLDSIVSVDGLNILANTQNGSSYNHMSNSAHTAFNIPNYPTINNDLYI